MTDQLFDIPESKSPRLLWMEKHGITTEYALDRHWVAWHLDRATGHGDTEDDALSELAAELGIRLWNEEVQS